MKELDIPVISVMIDHSTTKVILNDTKPQNIKELDILVFSVMIDQWTTNVVSNDTKLQHMKEFFMNVA